jgi:hypothetical protein
MRFLTHYEAKEILAGKTEVSLDLGITKGGVNASDFDAALLKKIAADEENVYFEDDGHWYKAMIRGRNVYKLRPTKPGRAPTHVISGIRMHVLTDDPVTNAESIVKTLGVRKGERLLDICTGMGYTAIAARKAGAYVTTIEIDEDVLELAKINPWSRGLFGEGIELLRGDAAEIVPTLGRFDAIIHDPPRFALAPQLYSTQFYKELARHAPRMAHYTGNPGAKAGKSFLKGVAERLREAGWKPTYNERLQGFICALA